MVHFRKEVIAEPMRVTKEQIAEKSAKKKSAFQSIVIIIHYGVSIMHRRWDYSLLKL